MQPTTAPSVPTALGPKPVPAPPVRVSRMTLANAKSTKRIEPLRTLLYASDGLGKSTFGATAPKPIFIAAESGLAEIDATAYPQPQSLDDVFDAIDDLTKSAHEFRTLVIDTLDWVEPLIWRKVCMKNGWGTIDQLGTFGKGYGYALEEWRLLLSRLEALWAKRQMDILLLAHSTIKNFKNPAAADYGRYVAAIRPDAYDLIKQWVGCVLFGIDEDATTDPKKGRVKGVSTGRRILHTERRAAWDAKNRYGLPPSIPLETYADYSRAARAGLQANPADVLAACEAYREQLGMTWTAEQAAYVEANRENAQALLLVLNKLRVKADEAAAIAASDTTNS